MLTFLGFFGVLIGRKNLVLILLCIEITYVGIILNFLSIGAVFSDYNSQIYGLTVIILAAELVIILSLSIVHSHRRKSINIDSLSILGSQMLNFSFFFAFIRLFFAINYKNIQNLYSLFGVFSAVINMFFIFNDSIRINYF